MWEFRRDPQALSEQDKQKLEALFEKLPRLLSYFKDRRAWLIEIGPKDVKLHPLGWQLPK